MKFATSTDGLKWSTPEYLTPEPPNSGPGSPYYGTRTDKGRIYQTFSAVAPDLLRMGGKDVEGTLGLSGPAVGADQLPDSHPSKPVALEFIKLYEAKFGAGSYNQFAANIWGAKLLLDKAIPVALKQAKPGLEESHREHR